MRLQIVGDGIEIDERIKAVVDEKFSEEIDKLLPQLEEDLKIGTLRLSKESHHDKKYRLVFNMDLPGKGGVIFSEESGEDLLNVLIALKKEVSRQIKDYKEVKDDARRS
jgi:ribosomal subunit interface protein